MSKLRTRSTIVQKTQVVVSNLIKLIQFIKGIHVEMCLLFINIFLNFQVGKG